MSLKTELHNFTDFDRLFVPRNFFITLYGSFFAFSFSYFSLLIFPVEFLGPPFRISITFAVVMLVSVYARNIASSGIVALVGGLGIVSPRGGGVEFAFSYIIIMFLLAVSLGKLADRLRLVSYWIKLYLFESFLFVLFLVGLSISSHNNAQGYRDLGYKIGVGGDLKTGVGLPLYEIITAVSLFFLILITLFVTRGHIILDNDSSKKYTVVGYIFIFLGHIVSFITLLLYSKTVKQEDMEVIARIPRHLYTVQDLFSHHLPGDYYAITVDPVNIYMAIAVSTVFISVGLSLSYIGRNQGNVEGMRGGDDVVYLAAPLGLFFFQIGGSYYYQNFVAPDGFFISVELMSMFTTMIWAVLFYNQIIARFFLYLVRKFSPNQDS